METYLDALIRAAIEEALASQDEGTISDIMFAVRGRSEYVAADSWTDGLLAEIERLRAIVDRLPKTADGVPVYVGDIVFVPYGDGMYGRGIVDCRFHSEAYWYATIHPTMNRIPVEMAVCIDYCYSTREAAERAAEGEQR